LPLLKFQPSYNRVYATLGTCYSVWMTVSGFIYKIAQRCTVNKTEN